MISSPGFSRWLLCGFLLLVTAAQAGPFDVTAEKLDQRIRRSADRLAEMQAEPTKRIPAELIARARGIIILHKFKAGFILGGEGGNGVALIRDARTGRWSAPAFIGSAEGSYGLQIGAQESDIILLLMNDAALKPLLGGSFNVGVDVEAAAGPNDAGGQIDTNTLTTPILVYSNSGGLFAGAAFKGGAIFSAEKQNDLYYRRGMSDILFDPAVRASASGQHLINVIDSFSGRGR
jgi:lipid-binding SYLF domain-containing protein